MSSICAKRDSPYALNGLIDRWKVFFFQLYIFPECLTRGMVEDNAIRTGTRPTLEM